MHSLCTIWLQSAGLLEMAGKEGTSLPQANAMTTDISLSFHAAYAIFPRILQKRMQGAEGSAARREFPAGFWEAAVLV